MSTEGNSGGDHSIHNIEPSENHSSGDRHINIHVYFQEKTRKNTEVQTIHKPQAGLD